MNFLRSTALLGALLFLLCSLLPAPLFAASDKNPVQQAKTPVLGRGEVDGIKVKCKKAAVYCVNTGEFLYDKGMNERIYPASTTKILTAVLALENSDPKQKVTVSQEASLGIPPGSSHIALEEGEVLTMQDIEYGMLLPSGNDCAVVAAETVSGSVEAFSELMNAKLEELGCKDSHFVNPHGFHEDGHYTTCHDLAIMMNYCIQNPDFVKIDSTIKYVVPKTNKSAKRELWNNHRMLESKHMYYEPIICGKSGYVNESKANLVSYGAKDGMELIVVVAGHDNPDQCCRDTKALMEYYFNNYRIESVALDEPLDPLEAEGKEIPVKLEEESRTLLLPKASAEGYRREEQLEEIQLPVKAGDKLGEVQLLSESETNPDSGEPLLLASIPILADQNVEAPLLKRSSLSNISIPAAGGLLLLVAAFLWGRNRKKKAA